MNKFTLVARSKLKKKLQAEREAKKGKRPKQLPWKKSRDGASQVLNDRVTETFKEYLINEARTAADADSFDRLRDPKLTQEQRDFINCVMSGSPVSVRRASYSGGVMASFVCGELSMRWDAGYTRAVHKKWNAWQEYEISKEEFDQYVGNHLRKYLTGKARGSVGFPGPLKPDAWVDIHRITK